MALHLGIRLSCIFPLSRLLLSVLAVTSIHRASCHLSHHQTDKKSFRSVKVTKKPSAESPVIDAV
ncbi:hypothetical protein M378DRAFT_165321 [Amanita muscaria Koide BX008]|uniref:Secreted protein n=1 Tax=Amanita muscaria (strain Koide BX008) TaxID=946122 RepID=A0A0C2X1U4_AMAMK|nr:hypothetical protein M378DRAFT_165321 [Amanita muscaria Koide BX008]